MPKRLWRQKEIYPRARLDDLPQWFPDGLVINGVDPFALHRARNREVNRRIQQAEAEAERKHAPAGTIFDIVLDQYVDSLGDEQ